MNAVGSVAIATSGNRQGSCCQRQNPLQQAMQQIMQYIQGYMAGQMVSQMLNGNGNQNGCMCSQRQNPNFGGQNPINSLMAGMQMGAMLGSLANQGRLGAQPFGGLGAQPAFAGLGAQPFGGLGAQPAFAGLGAQPFGGLGAQPAFAGLGNSSGLLAGMPSLGLTGLNGNSNSLFTGMPSLGLGGQGANSLFNGLPGGLAGVPNPHEFGQPVTPLAAGLPDLAFRVLGQNPNPGFAGSTNILGLIPPVVVPPLQNSLGMTVIPAGSGIPGAFGNNLGGFLG